MNDAKKLSSEIEVIITLTFPGIDKDRVSVKLSEILSKYDIRFKHEREIKNDVVEKIEMFLAALRVEGKSEKTIDGYRLELNMFSNHINKAVEKVNANDIRSFLSSNEHWMKSTRNRKLGVIRSFFKWLIKEDLLIVNPCNKIDPPKLPKRLPKHLNIEQLEIVREACLTKRDRALVEVLYSTACRLYELRNLKRSEINFIDQSIRVIGKGDKERIVYLSEKAYYHLRRYLETRKDDCDYVFVTERKPYRILQSRSVQDIIDKIEKRAGIKAKVTPHVFRHSFATLAVNQGADLVDVQHLLGHSQPSTTMIYATVSEERKKQAHRRFHVQ